ncbi:MAG: flagellar motor protein MotB [Fidelibacterota bacterium]
MATQKEKKAYKKGFKDGAESVEEGLPGWFGTFADMMTLLFAFFVLLAAISTIDPVKLQEMADSMGKKVGKTKKEGKAMNLADIKKAVDEMVKNMPEDETGKKPVEVRTSPKGVTLGISSDISFASGTADLQPGIIDVLKKLVPTIDDPNNAFPVAIEGHSDSDPLPERFQDKYPSNWELSAARAAAVVRELMKLGVDPTRLQAVGYAQYQPREKPTDWIPTEKDIPKFNKTPEEKALNRRVEITFLAR